MSFTPAGLKAYAGQTLTITYDAKVTKLLKPGETLQNNVIVPNSPNPYQSKTPITTGGKKFIKQDSSNSSKKLGGAVFALVKTVSGEKLYAHKTDAGYTWTKDNDKKTLVCDNPFMVVR